MKLVKKAGKTKLVISKIEWKKLAQNIYGENLPPQGPPKKKKMKKPTSNRAAWAELQYLSDVLARMSNVGTSDPDIEERLRFLEEWIENDRYRRMDR